VNSTIDTTLLTTPFTRQFRQELIGDARSPVVSGAIEKALTEPSIIDLARAAAMP